MSAFTRKLTALMEARGYSVRGLAKKLGVSENTYGKLCSGSRSLAGHEELMQRTMELLSLTLAERVELDNLMAQEILGEGVFATWMAVKELIEHLTAQQTLPLLDLPLYEIAPETSTRNAADTAALLQGFLANAIHDGGQLDIFSSAEQPFAFSFLRSALAAPGIHIRHAQALQVVHGNADPASAHNIARLTSVLSLAVSSSTAAQNYQPRYYYVNSTAEDRGGLLFPNVLIAGGRVLFCASDYRTAIYSERPDVAALCAQKFYRSYERCHTLIHVCATTEEKLVCISALLQDAENGNHLYTLHYQPCFMYFCSREDMDVLPGPLREPMRPLIDRYFYGLLQPLQEHHAQVNFFSLEGIQEFLRTGIVNELPHTFHHSIPTALRIALMERLLAAGNSGSVRLYLVRPEYLRIPKSIDIFSYDPGMVAVTFLDTETDDQCCFVEDYTLNTKMLDFLRWLETSPWCLSTAETCRVLAQELAQYKAALSDRAAEG